jgi:tetratricopeptide (TPR) repeat protein
VELVAALEVFDRVRVGFPEDALADEIEDHLAEIFPAPHTPVGQDRRDHRPVLFQRKLTDAIKQLLTGDMLSAFLGFFAQLDCVIESVAQEEICLAIIAAVLLHDEIEFFTEVEFLHSLLRRKERRNIRWRRPKPRLQCISNTVKTIHAFQLRAESKHAPRQRQLSARTASLLAAALLLPLSGFSADPKIEEELRAAKLMETTLFARQAEPAEWRKLDRFYEELGAKYPADATVKNAHAEWLWTMGEHDRAVDRWLAAEKIDPKNAVVLDHLGGSFLAGGDAKKAAAYYARATASVPENATYHHAYANVAFMFRHELLDAARPDASAMLRHALAHFAEAARLDPLNPEFARAYAETFYTVPDPDWSEALRAWQHVYEISPNRDFALLNIARVQMKLGDKNAAKESLARVQGSEFHGLRNRLRERIDTE